MPTIGLMERIARAPIMCDGAMKTQLVEQGFNRGLIPNKRMSFSTGYWNVDHPEVVDAVHRDYLDAGCELILTNTFKISSFHVLMWDRVKTLAEAARVMLSWSTQLPRSPAAPAAMEPGCSETSATASAKCQALFVREKKCCARNSNDRLKPCATRGLTRSSSSTWQTPWSWPRPWKLQSNRRLASHGNAGVCQSRNRYSSGLPDASLGSCR